MCAPGSEIIGGGAPGNPTTTLGRGWERTSKGAYEECPRLGVPSEAYFVRTTARGSLGTFHPWKVPRPGAKYPPSFSGSRDHGTGKRQTSSGAPGRRALRQAAPMTPGPCMVWATNPMGPHKAEGFVGERRSRKVSELSPFRRKRGIRRRRRRCRGGCPQPPAKPAFHVKPRRRKLHITCFPTGGKARSFRCSASPHRTHGIAVGLRSGVGGHSCSTFCRISAYRSAGEKRHR